MSTTTNTRDAYDLRQELAYLYAFGMVGANGRRHATYLQRRLSTMTGLSMAEIHEYAIADADYLQNT